MLDFVSTLILVIGFADDLRSRKIHNILLLGLLVFATLVVIAIRGIAGVESGLLTALLALALTFPLVFFGALGGGDMKLFTVFGLTSEPATVMQVYFYSLIAGALIGLVRAALSGQLITVLKSTALVAMDRAAKPSVEFKIPYSSALLLGWLIHCAGGLAMSGGSL